LDVMLKALLLTRDQEVLRVLRRVLETGAIELETVTSTDAARQVIDRRKFDAILIDCDDVQSGCDIVRELRKGKSNSKSIVFAITNRVTSVKDAFALGANFVLDKPISPDRATRSLRAAHGLILRERRRYHRHALQTTVHLTYGSQRDMPVPASNISEGGLALATKRTEDMKGVVSIRFELPGCTRSLEAKGEFVWTSDTGRVGIRFTTIPAHTKTELDSWISRQLEFAGLALMSAR
jgi:DNA-binding response OmpR family regulator